jgi:hypothetical protein
MDNSIEVKQNNTYNFSILIADDPSVILSGFTPYLAINFNTGITTIQGSAIVNGSTTFSVSAQENNVEDRVYEYEIYIQDGEEYYTVIQDSYSVLASLIIE